MSEYLLFLAKMGRNVKYLAGDFSQESSKINTVGEKNRRKIDQLGCGGSQH